MTIGLYAFTYVLVSDAVWWYKYVDEYILSFVCELYVYKCSCLNKTIDFGWIYRFVFRILLCYLFFWGVDGNGLFPNQFGIGVLVVSEQLVPMT